MTHWGSLEGVVLGPWELEGAGRPDRGHRQGKGPEPVVPTQSTKAAQTPLCHVFLSLSTEQLDLKKNCVYVGVGSFEFRVSLSRSCMCDKSPDSELQRVLLSLRYVF